MEEKQAPVNKGYQKQIKKEDKPVQPKKNVNVDYSSPLAKKWPKLVEAIERGDNEAVQKIMDEGFNMNLARGGVTPLMIAASKARTEVVKLLIESGVNVNEKNEDGWTALHKAVSEQADTAIVELLMESGIAIDAKDNAGKTALMLAEEKKRVDIVRAIKRHQGSKEEDDREWNEFLNSPDGKPYKASRRLDLMTSYSQLWIIPLLAFGGAGLLLGFFIGFVWSFIAAIVCALLFNGGYYLRMKMLEKYLDEYGTLPALDIHTLREKKKNGESLTLLKRIDLPLVEDTPAAAATDSAFSAVTVTMDEAPPAPEEQAKATPSFAVRMVERRNVILAAAAIIAVAVAGTGVVYRNAITKFYYAKKLERKGMSLSDNAFLDAAARNDAESLALFLKAGMAGTPKNEKGQTCLGIAAEKGHADLVGLFVGLDRSLLKELDGNGMTPLMTAAYWGREKMVRSLVEAGAEVNQIVVGREDAASALQAVLNAPEFKEDHARIVRYLLEKGADVQARNAAGRTALMFAAVHGRIEMAALLREKGAAISDVDSRGAGALQAAACGGHADFVAFLADQGADLKAASSEGLTPLMCAVRNSHVAAARALLDKGVDVDAKNPQGATALTEASVAGNVEVVKLLLERGADPRSGAVPDSFRTLSGKAVAISAKKKMLGDVIKGIAGTASQDGYAVKLDAVLKQQVAVKISGPWNEVLSQVAEKNRLFLIVKDKDIFLIPFNPSMRKPKAN